MLRTRAAIEQEQGSSDQQDTNCDRAAGACQNNLPVS